MELRSRRRRSYKTQSGAGKGTATREGGASSMEWRSRLFDFEIASTRQGEGTRHCYEQAKGQLRGKEERVEWN